MFYSSIIYAIFRLFQSLSVNHHFDKVVKVEIIIIVLVSGSDNLFTLCVGQVFADLPHDCLELLP